jgi:hypothetical protein
MLTFLRCPFERRSRSTTGRDLKKKFRTGRDPEKNSVRNLALLLRSGRGNLFFIIIMRVSLNVNISREMNFYDKNTCWGKGISKQNLFSQNTS